MIHHGQTDTLKEGYLQENILLVQVVVPGSVGEEKEEAEEKGEQPEISYSDTVKNRTNGEMTGLNLDQRKYKNFKSSDASPQQNRSVSTRCRPHQSRHQKRQISFHRIFMPL